MTQYGVEWLASDVGNFSKLEIAVLSEQEDLALGFGEPAECKVNFATDVLLL